MARTRPLSRPDAEPLPEALRRRAVVIAALVLLVVLGLHLLPALFGALGGYVLHELVRGPAPAKLAPMYRRVGNGLLAAALVAGAAFGIFEAIGLLLSASTDGLPRLMQLMADTLDQIRAMAPDWIASRLPDSATALQAALSGWLRSHAGQMQHWGREALVTLLQLLVGVAVGVMTGVSMAREGASTMPLPVLARARWRQLAVAFKDVLAAQLRIALVNAALTAVYLVAVLPLLGFRVPFAMTLVAFTFFASLVPIVGNLLSNAAIIIASLTVSPWLGVASLAYLVAIHKLEYFLNAHFVGSRVEMPVYALLASMLLLEAAFGPAGVVAAPIFCAWLTRELRENGWV